MLSARSPPSPLRSSGLRAPIQEALKLQDPGNTPRAPAPGPAPGWTQLSLSLRLSAHRLGRWRQAQFFHPPHLRHRTQTDHLANREVTASSPVVFILKLHRASGLAAEPQCVSLARPLGAPDWWAAGGGRGQRRPRPSRPRVARLL